MIQPTPSTSQPAMPTLDTPVPRPKLSVYLGLILLAGIALWPVLTSTQVAQANDTASSVALLQADDSEDGSNVEPLVGETDTAIGDDPLSQKDSQSESEKEPQEETEPVVDQWKTVTYPLIVVGIGMATVLGLIILLKVNAFLALLIAAIIVSLLSPGEYADKISRVASAFGSTAGGVGIVIAMAAIIGKCMLDSGAADRIVRAFLSMLGEKRAPAALMGSGFLLAVPVFFDTVFYLLVPLARSLHRKTGKAYLTYLCAIAAGGAITHTLVPPTPGPLLMASTLGIDFGAMMIVGLVVALPGAIVGLIYGGLADRWMKTPMRPLAGTEEPEPLDEAKLPSLFASLLPVVLPVLLIATSTLLTTWADFEPTTQFTEESFENREALIAELVAADDTEPTPAGRVAEVLPDELLQQLKANPSDEKVQADFISELNLLLEDRGFYTEEAFLGVPFSDDTKKLLGKNRERMRKAEVQRLNRLVMEQSLLAEDETALMKTHTWETTRRKIADIAEIPGNPNLALLISTIIALLILAKQRSSSLKELGQAVEVALYSGGLIILITSGGGAFGAMLKTAGIGGAIQELFGSALQDGGAGTTILLLAFALAAVLKIAQGSSTVAMIVGSSMMAAIITPSTLSFPPVLLATAIGSGSLFASWMNDSGFWIFAKMGGLTEAEALKSWTVILTLMSLTGLGMTLLLSLLPLQSWGL